MATTPRKKQPMRYPLVDGKVCLPTRTTPLGTFMCMANASETAQKDWEFNARTFGWPTFELDQILELIKKGKAEQKENAKSSDDDDEDEDGAWRDEVWARLKYRTDEDSFQPMVLIPPDTKAIRPWSSNINLLDCRATNAFGYTYASGKSRWCRVAELQDLLISVNSEDPEHFISKAVRDVPRAFYNSGSGSSISARTLVLFDIVVLGFHSGELVNVESAVKAFPNIRKGMISVETFGGTKCLIVCCAGSRFVFPGLVPVESRKAIMADARQQNVSQAAFAEAWAESILQNVRAELRNERDALIKYRRLLQEKTLAVMRLSEMEEIAAFAGNGIVQKIIDSFYRAGFVGHEFTPYGIQFRTAPLFIDYGDHETENAHRYLGQFDVMLSLTNSLSIRNVASPKKGECHAVLDQDDCLGTYDDILANAFRIRDYELAASTLLALITHFDKKRHESHCDHLPTAVPEQTFVSKYESLFGSEAIYELNAYINHDSTSDDNDFEDDEDEEDED